MPDNMGTFRVDVEIENPALPGTRARAGNVLVDTGAELSWFPAALLESLDIRRRVRSRFRQADGSILERWTGSAWLYVAGATAPTTSSSLIRAISHSSAPGLSRD